MHRNVCWRKITYIMTLCRDTHLALVMESAPGMASSCCEESASTTATTESRSSTWSLHMTRACACDAHASHGYEAAAGPRARILNVYGGRERPRGEESPAPPK